MFDVWIVGEVDFIEKRGTAMEDKISLFALLVLAIFYGIYFIKMLVQKRHGIQMYQIGRRKEKEVHEVEKHMSIATVGVVAAQLISIGFNFNHMPTEGRFDGFLVGMFGNVIFLIAILSMKDSWRAGIPDKDKTTLITTGIYKYSRNPAFLGFDFMYLGVMLMYFNGLTILFTVYAMVMLHLQIKQEEKYLVDIFGKEYQAYQKQVRRYLGRY